MVERRKFRQRSQLPDEGIKEYVTALRGLAIPCNYGTMLDETLRDQLVDKALLPQVRERLLLEGSALTLERATQIASHGEQSRKEAQRILQENTAAFDKVFKKPFKRSAGKPATPKPQAQGKNATTCFRCGSAYHLANSQECKARYKELSARKLGIPEPYGEVQKSSTLHPDVHPAACVNRTSRLFQAGDPIERLLLDLRIDGALLQFLETEVTSGASERIAKCEFANLFSPELGLAKGYEHKVKVRTDVHLTTTKLRMLPLQIRDDVSKELKKLLDMDVIEPIDASPWVSPLVVTKKKDGRIRLCVDLRAPNKAVVPDCYPLPNMEELLHKLSGANIFSKLDLTAAYYQLLLAEESRDLTAFITHEGLFRYKRLCFRLASASSAFQKLLANVLKGCTRALHYLDDIIIFGKNGEHEQNLRSVLQRISDAGLQLNHKCVFGVNELSFIGHTVKEGKLFPLETNVKAILEAPAPSDLRTLRSFLGMSGHYAKFIKNYAHVVEPVRELLRGADAFHWIHELNYNFTVVYKKGNDNEITDALSRLPLPHHAQEPFEDDVVCIVTECISKEQLQRETTSDSVMQDVLLHIRTEWPWKASLPDNAVPFFKLRTELSEVDGPLLRGDRVVVPPALASRVFGLAHEVHPGIVRTKQRLRQLYWRPAMDRHVETAIRGCDICQTADKSRKTAPAPLTSVKLPEGPWEKVSTDVVGPFEKFPQSCRYMITLIDYHSRWPEMCFSNTVTTSTVIVFLRQIFSREGHPVEIMTDNGCQFISHEFRAFLQERGIRHIRSSVYHPQRNGMIERFNKVLKSFVQVAQLENRPIKEAVLEYIGGV
ncbi:uncharacterized protein K02A2.6-like [Ornithodoros turicata]|uniref:uncharacterized protein K02A2.6-like n=1 Tax=Ornithodoros turicata TaxID=34597 RepID=UPI003138AA18